MLHRPRALFALSLASLVTVIATADDAHAGDPAAAQALFDQARKLMSQERWAEACPKLDESQRLDPGGGTLLHLAICREHEGKIATAWARYQDALAVAKRDGRKDRARIAQGRIDAIRPRLPRIRVRVAAQNRALPGFRVSRDDVVVGEAQWGESVPVDPGTRTITARADGYTSWTTEVDIPAAASETTVDVPELEQADEAAAPAPGPAAASEPATAAGSEQHHGRSPTGDPTRGDTQRTIGVALGGVGVVGIAVGSVFGLLAIAKQSEADRECRPPDGTLCSAAGVEAGKDGTTFGDVSTIAFVAGGVLLVGGAALYFAAPEPTKKIGIAPSFGPGRAGLSLGGRF